MGTTSMGLIKEFKEFAMKGNVIDMAPASIANPRFRSRPRAAGRLRQKCVNLDRVRKTSETRLILTRIPTFAHRTPSARKDCSCQYHSQSPSFPTAVQIHVFLVQSPWADRQTAKPAVLARLLLTGPAIIGRRETYDSLCVVDARAGDDARLVAQQIG